MYIYEDYSIKDCSIFLVLATRNSLRRRNKSKIPMNYLKCTAGCTHVNFYLMERKKLAAIERNVCSTCKAGKHTKRDTLPCSIY